MGYFSNSDEGIAYEEAFCTRCVHSDWREGKELGDADNPPCPIWMAHMMYAYELCNAKDHPGKVMLDMFIPRKDVHNGECAMFFPKDKGAAILGQTTMDVAA